MVSAVSVSSFCTHHLIAKLTHFRGLLGGVLGGLGGPQQGKGGKKGGGGGGLLGLGGGGGQGGGGLLGL